MSEYVQPANCQTYGHVWGEWSSPDGVGAAAAQLGINEYVFRRRPVTSIRYRGCRRCVYVESEGPAGEREIFRPD